jgi:hypothetical protein
MWSPYRSTGSNPVLTAKIKIKIMGITIISLVCIIIYTFLLGYQLGRGAVINRINKKLNDK